jgi:hypothetical protein
MDNRFSRPGEALLIAERGGRWVGVCGLNVDPYLDDRRVGRDRRDPLDVPLPGVARLESSPPRRQKDLFKHVVIPN